LPIDVGPIRAADFPATGNLLHLKHTSVSPIPEGAADAGIRGTGEDCATEVARSCREGPRGGTRVDGCA